MIWNPTPPEPSPQPTPYPDPPNGTGGWHPPPGGYPGETPTPRDPNGGGGLGTKGGRTGGGGLNREQQGAFDQMALLLQQFGLESLFDFLKNLIMKGTTDAASLQLELQNRVEWKTRFAGNEMLKASGLGVLSPAEYLQMEKSYGQVMRNYGLPSGFYDSPQDFAKWIGGNVSVNELQQRMADYSDLVSREDPTIVKQLESMGMTKGDILAHLVDPSRAMPILQKQYQQVLLGGAARRAGFAADNDYLGELAARGVTEDTASRGFGIIAEALPEVDTLSQVYGEDYNVADLQNEVFDNNGLSARKRKRLASQERAAFSGSAGASGITRNPGGSY